MFYYYLILLLVNYCTYGFVVSNPRETYTSHFSLHPIRVVCLYDMWM